LCQARSPRHVEQRAGRCPGTCSRAASQGIRWAVAASMPPASNASPRVPPAAIGEAATPGPAAAADRVCARPAPFRLVARIVRGHRAASTSHQESQESQESQEHQDQRTRVGGGTTPVNLHSPGHKRISFGFYDSRASTSETGRVRTSPCPWEAYHSSPERAPSRLAI
jgi:hypothetical protein